jgi:hypothetical protein
MHEQGFNNDTFDVKPVKDRIKEAKDNKWITYDIQTTSKI